MNEAAACHKTPDPYNIKRLTQQILDWGHARGILDNGTAQGQAIKTHEEVGELMLAIGAKNQTEIRDAIGDIYVTLVLCSACAGLSINECIAAAYDEIKDRKGYLNEQGIFVKETNA